jgi:endonuclease/exonuclease/phosphatase (EEP) superfamily protein YafD
VGKLRGFVGVVAALALADAAMLTVLRLVDTSARLPALATAFASYGFLGFLLALLLLLLLVRRAGRLRPVVLVGLALSLLGLVVQGFWASPLFLGSSGARTDLTVMTANLRFGIGDPTTVVRSATDRKVDLLVLEEVTPTELVALDRAGLSALLRYRAGTPATTAEGTMVFSRYQLGNEGALDLVNGGLAVDVAASQPFRLLAVHTAQPLNQPGPWRDDLREVRDQVAKALEAGSTMVVGDFNATRDHPAFRSVLGLGLRDAAEQANAGWQATWPTSARGPYLRPVITIDHVLVSKDFAAVRTSTVDVEGTDHRALVAELDRR